MGVDPVIFISKGKQTYTIEDPQEEPEHYIEMIIWRKEYIGRPVFQWIPDEEDTEEMELSR